MESENLDEAKLKALEAKAAKKHLKKIKKSYTLSKMEERYESFI